jgi:hypothetical protein
MEIKPATGLISIGLDEIKGAQKFFGFFGIVWGHDPAKI